MPQKSQSLARIKENGILYLNSMGSYGKYTSMISGAIESEDVFYALEQWFYLEFLRYHREQFLNSYEFINSFSGKEEAEIILAELANFFRLSLNKDDELVLRLSSQSLQETLSNGAEIDLLSANAAERELTKNYNPYMDLICFLYAFNRRETGAASRLVRIIQNFSPSENRILLENIHTYYPQFDVADKIKVLSELCSCINDEDSIFEFLYRRVPKDQVFYAILMQKCNERMEEMK